MTLQEMAQALQAQAASNGSVTLDNALLGSGNAFAQAVITALLRSEGNIILSAESSAIPANPTGNSFSFNAGIPGVAEDSFLNLLDNAVVATISLEGSTFQVELSIALTQAYLTGAPLPWLFSTSFPVLFGWPFDAMPFTGQEFQFVFAPVQVPSGLSQGLNFSSRIILTGLLQAVVDFLATFRVHATVEPMAGAITQTIYGPSFDLRASLGVPALNLVALQIASPFVGISMDYISVEGTDEEYESNGQLYIGAYTSLEATSPTPTVQLITVFRLPLMGAMPILNMSILPATQTDTTLDNLGQWMAGQSWNAFFAEEPASTLLPFLQSFGLRSYSMEFDLGQFRIAATTLCVGTLSPWQVVPSNPNLIVNQFAVTWTVFMPFSNPQSMLAINCEMDMFGDGQVTFTGSILLPDLRLTLTLAAAQEMTAAQWLQTILTAFGGGTLPSYLVTALSTFSLEMMLFSMDAPAQSGEYNLVGGFEFCGSSVNFNFLMEISLKPSFSYRFWIAFFFSSVRLEGEIAKENDTIYVSGRWANDTNPLGLNDIAESLGYESLGIPPQMDLGLVEVGVTYDQTHTTFLIKATSDNYGLADILMFMPAGGTSFVFFGGLEVNKPIDLTNLPLIGKALSVLETVEIRNLRVQITSAPIDQATAQQLNNLISTYASGYPAIPNEGMASTVNVSMEIAIGGFVVPLGTGVGGDSNTSLPSTRSSVLGSPGGNTSAPVPTTPGAQSDGTTWFNIQKAIGPVMFKRIGVRYRESVLWFALDATFSAGGLTIDLIGMAIGSPLSSWDPQFTLDGLGISFEEPGFQLAGALLKVPPTEGIDWQYAGGAILRIANFSLSALGSYASMSGTPSMFIFAQVTGTFGGPPAFFVTGLAAGFGYNSALRLPGLNELYQFPLVAGAQDPSKIGGTSPTPAEALSVLMGLSGGMAWVTLEAGQYWFAAGLQFSSYQLVSTNALLIVEFGKRILFALLGLSRASFPLPGTVPSSIRYAFIELQLATIIDPEQGAFSVSAVLSPNSYLLDPSCKLTGGFAFYAWFPPSAHSGDFVITVGGYHPSFDPPSWYPLVPRVGVTWSLDSTVSITGTAYFALTPSAIMAGGQLSVTYQEGDLRAWFRAWANMLIYWNPFHFDVEIGVTVGASYRLDLGFTTQTLEAELGATLNLWGPDTGGEVVVHWWVISFTIGFGASRTPNSPPLTWTQFQEQLPPTEDMVKIFPVAGLAPNGETDLNAGAPWVARPSGFTFNTMSAVPDSQLLLGSQGTSFQTSNLLNIRPMAQDGLTSIQTLVLTKDQIEIDLLASGWQVTAVTQNVAKALWVQDPRTRWTPETRNWSITNWLGSWYLRHPILPPAHQGRSTSNTSHTRCCRPSARCLLRQERRRRGRLPRSRPTQSR